MRTIFNSSEPTLLETTGTRPRPAPKAGDLCYADRFGWRRRVRVMRVMRSRGLVACTYSSGLVEVFSTKLSHLLEPGPVGGNGTSRNPAPQPEKAAQALAAYDELEARKRERRSQRNRGECDRCGASGEIRHVYLEDASRYTVPLCVPCFDGEGRPAQPAEVAA